MKTCFACLIGRLDLNVYRFAIVATCPNWSLIASFSRSPCQSDGILSGIRLTKSMVKRIQHKTMCYAAVFDLKMAFVRHIFYVSLFDANKNNYYSLHNSESRCCRASHSEGIKSIRQQQTLNGDIVTNNVYRGISMLSAQCHSN